VKNSDECHVTSDELKPGVRVIFLDMDGVMNSHRSITEEYESRRSGNSPRGITTCHWMAPYHVEPLNRIIRDTGAKVVISSSWRLSNSSSKMQKFLQAAGVECEVIGQTPYEDKPMNGFPSLYGGSPRGSEINSWLIQHSEVESYVTDAQIGLTEELADQAIAMLNEVVDFAERSAA
jgi:hypothetical protein